MCCEYYVALGAGCDEFVEYVVVADALDSFEVPQFGKPLQVGLVFNQLVQSLLQQSLTVAVFDLVVLVREVHRRCLDLQLFQQLLELL